MEKQADLLLDTKKKYVISVPGGGINTNLCETQFQSLQKLNWHQSGQSNWWLIQMMLAMWRCLFKSRPC